MIRWRDSQGAKTTFRWVHSHTDKAHRRRWNPKCKHECACGGQGKQECDPTHAHHIGNERADTLATQGMHSQVPADTQLQVLAGEEEYHLATPAGMVCQGDIAEYMKRRAIEAEVARLEKDGNKGTKGKLALVHRLRLTDQQVRKKLTTHKETSLRFRVRLWADLSLIHI